MKRLGGDGVVTLTEDMDQTIVGIYWDYEGPPILGTPPRLWNQIAAHAAARKRTKSGLLTRHPAI